MLEKIMFRHKYKTTRKIQGTTGALPPEEETKYWIWFVFILLPISMVEENQWEKNSNSCTGSKDLKELPEF